MHQDIYTDLKQQIRRKKRRTVFNRAVSILACTVMFCTTYALILPAITMEQETFCGVEEHSHSEACYGAAQQTMLVCTAEHLDIHTHDDSCYGPEGNLVCGQCDYVAHSHDTGCYSPAGALVCTLPERSVHVHTDSCYVPGETQPEVLHVHSDSCNVLQRGDLTCTLEESEGHTHGDACFEPGDELLCTKQENHIHDSGCYEVPLVCTRSTEPHVHDGSCYGRGELTCSIPQNHVHGDGCRETTCICNNEAEDHTHDDSCYESRTLCNLPENHSHGDSCYESIPVCGKAEGECHTHDTGCYGDEKLICTQEENHVHTGSCYQPELICTTAEYPGHTHGDDCYEQVTIIGCGLEEGQIEPTEPVAPVLTCTEPAAQVHVHGDGCFETVTTEAVPICGNTAADHIHEPACYELHCGLEEHIHSTACYSNPDADLETREQWEASFAQVELTGDWNEDVLAIARTQLGYVESTNNYAVWEDGTTHGYTRYGQWYGSPYGDWCAMFVSFCLHYAEVEGMPLHWGVRPWIEELTDLKLYHEAEVYDPKPGDIIFYDWEGDDLSDHVGFVAEIIPADEDDPAQVKALEGNSSNCVQYVYYDLDDSRILGYSELPDNPEIYSCGLLRHSHNEYCYDDADNFICQQIEHIHTDVCEPRDTLYCGLEIHTHGEGCFDEAGELVCQIPEHSHTDTCYVQAPAEEEEVEPTYFCGLEEHTHAETCYNEAGELVCELTEHTHSEECTVEPVTYYCGLEEHTHGETCYNEAGELVCELTEHTHSEECITEPVTYYCGLEEHTHGETCYNEAGELVCEISEHTHSEECTTEPVTYYCGLEEHIHGETCYNETGELVCELTEHTHSEACTVEPVTYYCGLEEHTHGETCYNEAGELVCEISEHTHSEECITEPVTYYCFRQAHTHSDVCYDEAGNLLCQIPEHTHTDECTKIPVFLCGMQEHAHSEECYDDAGELICQLHVHTHSEQCIIPGGYICGLTEHTHNENCYDAEGNFICTLEEHTHTDACRAQNAYACGLTEHTHGESCYDAEGNLICQIPEHIHSAACVGRSLYYSDMQIRVHAVIRGVEDLPQKLTLKVRKVIPEQEPQSFGEMQVAVSEEMSGKSQYLSQASFYEMYLLSEGQIYNLPETASVTVTMDFEEPIFTPDAMADAAGTHAFMLTPEGGMQLPSDLPEGEEIPAETEESAESAEPSLVESVISNIASSFQSILTPALALDDASQLEEIPAGEGEGEIPADSEIPENLGTAYEVSGLTDENYGNAQQGITSVTFTTNRISTFAVALADDTLTGKFWNRIYDPADIVSGGTYLIISAEGNMALNGTGGNTAVQLQTVKSHEDHYIIKLANDGQQVGSSNADGTVVGSNLYWTVTRGNNNRYTIQNQSSSRYVYLNNAVVSQYSANLTLTEEDAENCIRIANGNNYLRNTGGTSFSYGDGNDGSTRGVTLYNSRDMMFFTLSDTKSLRVPIDVDDGKDDDTNDSGKPTKPNYDAFITPTHGKSGDTAVTGEGGVTIEGNYYSDPSTSQLEANFQEDTFAENMVNDGKVMTDKSVIYGDDDYDAFDSYESNIFSVTLSALGQEYKVAYQSQVRTPVDVVYILDVSGSMSTESTSTDGGRDPDRATAVVKAVNDSMKRIMDDHEENRVGIVLYSSGAWEMLPLDRYKADNNEYLININETLTHEPTNYTPTVNKIVGSSTLTNEAGTASYANAGRYNAVQGIGTYTQAGIAMGYKVFQDIGTDTTYTVETANGPKEIIRQPVFILLSDGEPTHSTNIYMDVLNGPHYGNGQGAVSNAKGIMGYNTILSANYYKRMVAIQYQKPVKFFTVGMSIHATADGPLVDGSDTGDNYKRFVLNPRQSQLSGLTGQNAAQTTTLLRNLLNSDYDDQSVAVGNLWPDNWMGDPHSNVPVVTPNPYAGNYDYATNAFFGDLDNEQLKKIFANILTYSTEESPYSFILYKDTYVTIQDTIGEGMEIKGTPVLRYEGVNYPNPAVSTTYFCGDNACTITDAAHIHEISKTKYTYSGTYTHPYLTNTTVDLSQIQVTVTTDASGQQTVDMVVPDAALPTYTPSLDGAYYTGDNVCGKDAHTHIPRYQENSCYNWYTGRLTCDLEEHTHTDACKYDDSMFYYEALPVRLIYQVGLTEESEAAVLNLQKTGGQLTFYTNAFEELNVNGNAAAIPYAQTNLYPSTQNPFYFDQDLTDDVGRGYHTHTDIKSENVTGTAAFSTYCSDDENAPEETYRVVHMLGNNGKLVFEAETVEIPVVKTWGDGVNAADMSDVTAVLYSVTETTDNSGKVTCTGTKVTELTLGTSNSWSNTFENLPAPGTDFYYAIAESNSQDFQVRYSGGEVVEIIVDSEPLQAVKVTADFFASEPPGVITITNLPGIELPKTGGSGTTLYTAGGLLLMTAAIYLLLDNRKYKISRPQ